MSDLLIIASSVYAQGIPDAQALIISNGTVAWIGDRDTALSLTSDVDHVVDAGDSFIAPGFVDAHVHLSATGMYLKTDVSHARSYADLADVINHRDTRYAVTFGHGWDDTHWQDTLLDFTHALDRTKIGQLYLTRVDVHGAIVLHPSVNNGEPVILTGKEHETYRGIFLEQISPEQRRDYIRIALEAASAQGIVSVHENGGPVVSSADDFRDTLTLGRQAQFPEVIGYWGDGNISQAQALGAAGAGGDYSVDGSLGSRTARLSEPYSDVPNHLGNSYLDETKITEHIVACTNAGIQAGFHVIGDQAVSRVSSAFARAAQQLSSQKLRSCRHRLEHVEMPSSHDLETFAQHGVVLSVKPVFDELWGTSGGMYEQRVGKPRSEQMNPFAQMLNTGIVLAFGSDTPVTPMNPWRAIRAAINHNEKSSRISARAAFVAHTRGGWRAARRDSEGMLAVGAPAHLAIWDANEFLVDVPDDRHVQWSTDDRSGVPLLPDVRSELPRCVATIRNGEPIYDPHALFATLPESR